LSWDFVTVILNIFVEGQALLGQWRKLTQQMTIFGLKKKDSVEVPKVVTCMVAASARDL
jgi:hypothetical protein